MKVKKLKNELIKQKKNKTKGNIYHFSQINFAFNSNKIEGSKISEDETIKIFETNSYKGNSDDEIEIQNHFKLFDYMLDNLDKSLTKEMIIEMNVILKKNTSKENKGGFKTHNNTIGVINEIKTTDRNQVEESIDSLLNKYNSLDKITLEDIIEFHYNFEIIHPFEDGNGRVGRMIMFKECLRNNIMPMIILDSDKHFYLRGLNQYKNDKLFLIDTIKNEQDIYEKIINDLYGIDNSIKERILLREEFENYNGENLVKEFEWDDPVGKEIL